jgi:hypothetical protein
VVKIGGSIVAHLVDACRLLGFAKIVNGITLLTPHFKPFAVQRIPNYPIDAGPREIDPGYLPILQVV